MRNLIIICMAAASGGCASMGYYAQSIHGQLDILARSRPISDIIEQPDTPAALKQRLASVLKIRRFASEVLQLPDNDSYMRYADVGRQYAVWNVFAAPELSMTPHTWCFPIVGCVIYRGYFSLHDAQQFATRLEQDGKDVFIGGVPAYSTLGWFDDPMLNTVMHYSEVDLAGLVFHELAHQVVYVKNDSVFNESFATVVELEGVRRWLGVHGDSAQIDEYRLRKQRDGQVVELILNYRQRLSEAYAAAADDAWKRAQKRALLSELRGQFEDLTQDWHGYQRYRKWFAEPINNAKLIAVLAYYDWVPAFEALLERHHGDLKRFYAQVKRLAKLSDSQRGEALRTLKRRLVAGR